MNEELKNQIKEYFKDKNSKREIPNTCVNKFLKLNPKIKNEFDEIIKNDYRFKTYFELIFFIKFNESLGKCKHCGKELTYEQTISKNDFCSVKCQRNSLEVKEKIKKTNLERYGTEYPSQSEIVKEKVKKTNLEKFGVEWYTSSNEMHEKSSETLKNKYNVENISQVEEIKKKKIQTSLKHFGTEYPLQSELGKQKLIKTNQEKLGVDFPFQSKEIQNKVQKTHFEKYGSISPSNNPIIKQKLITRSAEYHNSEKYKEDKLKREKENLQKFGVKNIGMLEAWNNICNLKDKEPLFSLSDYKGKKYEYKWRCKKCGHEFYSRYQCGNLTRKCPNCEVIHGYSLKEKNLLNFCKSYFDIVKENSKLLIAPFEIDIIIPEIKLALEFNGNYWHSKFGWKKERKNLKYYFGYHLRKTILCNEKGYRLIHIWEDEWDKDENRLKERLAKIFKGEENLAFTDKEIILDRSWHNGLSIPGYELIEEIPPKTVDREGYEVENCGWLKYRRIL